MRIGIVYTGAPKYMTDCWHALACTSGVRLKIWTEEDGQFDIFGDAEARLADLDATIVNSRDINELRLCETVAEISDFKPDVLLVSGWSLSLPRRVATDKSLRDIPKVLDFDMPWEWRLRKVVARFVLGPYIHNFRAAFVPGQASEKYARWLGFRRDKIIKGRNCFNVKMFSSCSSKKPRKGFLFIGRFVEVKALDVLAKAYEKYRASVDKMEDIWPLNMYGKGDSGSVLVGMPGVNMRGVILQEDAPAVYAKAGALILPSRREAWGMVLAEAAASGCPIICTDRCGASNEFVKQGENGFVVPAEDANALAKAMYSIANGKVKCDGEIGRELAKEYSCEKWVARVLQLGKMVKC